MKRKRSKLKTDKKKGVFQKRRRAYGQMVTMQRKINKYKATKADIESLSEDAKLIVKENDRRTKKPQPQRLQKILILINNIKKSSDYSQKEGEEERKYETLYVWGKVISLEKTAEIAEKDNKCEAKIFYPEDDPNGVISIEPKYGYLDSKRYNFLENPDHGQDRFFIKEFEDVAISFNFKDLKLKKNELGIKELGIKKGDFALVSNVFLRWVDHVNVKEYKLKGGRIESLHATQDFFKGKSNYQGLIKKLVSLSRVSDRLPIIKPLGSDYKKNKDAKIYKDESVIFSCVRTQEFHSDCKKEIMKEPRMSIFPSCITETTGTRRLIMTGNLIEKDGKGNCRLIELRMSAYETEKSKQDKKNALFKSVAVYRPKDFEILMTMVSTKQETVETRGDMPLYAAIASPKKKDVDNSTDDPTGGWVKISTEEDEEKNLKIPIGDGKFKNKVAFAIDYYISGLVFDIPSFFKEQYFGIPVSPFYALMHLMKKEKKLESNGILFKQDKIMKITEETLKKTNGSEKAKFVVSCKDVKNEHNLDYGLGEKKPNEYYNLSEFNGNVGHMFRDVNNGKAKFYFWTAGPTTTTDTLIKYIKKNRSDDFIEDFDGVNTDALFSLITGMDTDHVLSTVITEAKPIVHLFIVYNDEDDEMDIDDDDDDDETEAEAEIEEDKNPEVGDEEPSTNLINIDDDDEEDDVVFEDKPKEEEEKPEKKKKKKKKTVTKKKKTKKKRVKKKK